MSTEYRERYFKAVDLVGEFTTSLSNDIKVDLDITDPGLDMFQKMGINSRTLLLVQLIEKLKLILPTENLNPEFNYHKSLSEAKRTIKSWEFSLKVLTFNRYANSRVCLVKLLAAMDGKEDT